MNENLCLLETYPYFKTLQENVVETGAHVENPLDKNLSEAAIKAKEIPSPDSGEDATHSARIQNAIPKAWNW